MTNIARLFHVARRVTGRGGRVSVPPHFLLNLSFVLHESSASDAVRRTAEAAARHSMCSAGVPSLNRHDIVIDGTQFIPDEWLTARLGYPHLVADALTLTGMGSGPIAVIDAVHGITTHPFFRASALLAIDPHLVHSSPRHPSDRRNDRVGGGGASNGRTVGVVVLVARPGKHGAQLIVRGPYDQSTGIDQALRQVEALIQSYADQWIPERALWDAPAEVLLAGEVR